MRVHAGPIGQARDDGPDQTREQRSSLDCPAPAPCRYPVVYNNCLFHDPPSIRLRARSIEPGRCIGRDATMGVRVSCRTGSAVPVDARKGESVRPAGRPPRLCHHPWPDTASSLPSFVPIGHPGLENRPPRRRTRGSIAPRSRPRTEWKGWNLPPMFAGYRVPAHRGGRHRGGGGRTARTLDLLKPGLPSDHRSNGWGHAQPATLTRMTLAVVSRSIVATRPLPVKGVPGSPRQKRMDV